MVEKETKWEQIKILKAMLQMLEIFYDYDYLSCRELFEENPEKIVWVRRVRVHVSHISMCVRLFCRLVKPLSYKMRQRCHTRSHCNDDAINFFYHFSHVFFFSFGSFFVCKSFCHAYIRTFGSCSFVLNVNTFRHVIPFITQFIFVFAKENAVAIRHGMHNVTPKTKKNKKKTSNQS